MFQTMNYVRSNSLSLKYQGFPLSDCQDIGIRKFEFVAKTQFLCPFYILEIVKIARNNSQNLKY